MRMKSRGKMFFVMLFTGLCIFLSLAFSGGEQTRPDTNDLKTMTVDSGKAYQKGNFAVASGVGRIREDTAQERLLARRAALLDARRNLLVLRRKLLEDSRSAPVSLSGHVAAHKVSAERVEGNLYFLEVEVPLDELLKADFTINFSNYWNNK